MISKLETNQLASDSEPTKYKVSDKISFAECIFDSNINHQSTRKEKQRKKN